MPVHPPATFRGGSGDVGARFRDGRFGSGPRAGFRGGFDRFGGHRFFHGHRGPFFSFFFAPLFFHGFVFPYDYYWPYYDYPYPGYAYAYPDYVPDDEAAESGFEPYYGDWKWSEKDGYYTCRYYLSPRGYLVVVAYPDDRDLLYFYDPAARQWIGVLDRSSGEFRHWYEDEHDWSDPERFPFSAPPSLGGSGGERRGRSDGS